MRVKIAWVLTVVCASALAQEGTGTIRGVVVDEDGKPVPRAEVHIVETKPFAGHRVLKFHETNDEGRFVIEKVAWGTYTVLVGKESAGYPDTKLAFYSNLAVPRVTLAPAFPTATVNLKMTPKAGTLDLAPVTDVVTNEKIGAATITLRRTESPKLFMTMSATEGPILIPPMTAVSLEVTAPGYKPWPTYGRANFGGQIRLEPGEVLKLEVRLQPE